MELTFASKHFEVETIEVAGRRESVVRGGRHLFDLLPKALEGIERIGVIGWGSQGPAQAQNLRESLDGRGIGVTVGLRPNSPSMGAARAVGFSEEDGSLGEMFEVIASSDLVLLLISDAAQAELHPRVFEALRPGSTLGLSHGFLLAHLRNQGERFPDHVNVIAVCPKGMGPSVRRLYEQGREINGAGINASFAVEQDLDGRAGDCALGWSIALGAPWTFMTTLENEFRSDVFGERAILLGAVWGIVEALYRHYREEGTSEEEAFVRTAETITGPIARTISRSGLDGLYHGLDAAARRRFELAYELTYPPALELLVEIYDEVASGNEIRSVVMAGERLKRSPMPPIEGTRMWRVGQAVRAGRGAGQPAVDGFTAGVFCAVMVAQCDVLAANGHAWSEIANESVIEAVDSLLPYMHARGIAYMVDNCSTTARLGTRKWGPRWDYALVQQVLPWLQDDPASTGKAIEAFPNHPIHDVLRVVGGLRPSVDISVQ